jgi:hypothetical protein
LVAHKLTLAILAQIVLDDPSPSLSHFLEAIHEFYKSIPPISPPPAPFTYAHLHPLLLLVLPFSEFSFAALKNQFGNSTNILESLWAFYTYGLLEEYTKAFSTTLYVSLFVSFTSLFLSELKTGSAGDARSWKMIRIFLIF